MINEENIKQDLIVLTEKYISNNETIVLDKRKEVLVSLYHILHKGLASNYNIDKSNNHLKELQENKENELRRATNRNLSLFDTIIIFEILQHEYDEITLEALFGISKNQIKHVNDKIQSLLQTIKEFGINFENDKWESFLILNQLELFGTHEFQTDTAKLYEIITSAPSKELKTNILNLANKNVKDYQRQLFCFLEEFNIKGLPNNNILERPEILLQIAIELSQKYQEESNSIFYEYSDKFNNDEIDDFILIFRDHTLSLLLYVGYIYSKDDFAIIYKTYHKYLEKYADRFYSTIKEYTNKSLYKGYSNWCKKEGKEPLIKLSFTTTSSSTKKTIIQNDSLVGKLHFEKKSVYAISETSDYDPSKLTISFYKRLHKALIDNSIISPNTKEADFVFILGYRTSASKLDFKKVEILKPTETAKQYTGKSLIIQLLLLIGYNIDEIRGNGQYFKDKPTKKKDLILKNCFSPEFTPQDFQFKNNQISFNETICRIVRKAYTVMNEEILDKKYITTLDNYIKNKVRVDVSSINQNPKI